MHLTQISFSSLSDYLLCPLKYFYRKIAQITPEFTAAELCYGKGIHASLEAHFNAVKEGKSHSEGYLIKLFRDTFQVSNVRYNGQNLDELTDEAAQLLQQAIGIDVGEVLGVEQPIEVQVADFKIIGYMDLVTMLNGETTIWDWKTSKKRPSQGDIDNNLQFSTYNLAYPHSAFKVVALLKQKKPSVEVYDTRREFFQRKRTIKTYVAVKSCIEAGHWYPKESWACGSCPYQTQCAKDF